MRRLLNSLYVLTPEAYLSLDGENVVVRKDEEEMGRFPLHTLEQIVCFSYKGASPALMGKCAEGQVEMTFYTPGGRFLCRVGDGVRGNVLLRRKQYRVADEENAALPIARSFILGKVYNARWVIERAIRDHPLSVDTARLQAVSAGLQNSLWAIENCVSADSLRGIEGEAASLYFSVFDELILCKNPAFRFDTRNRRPPLDRVNALLSFAYSLLTGQCASA